MTAQVGIAALAAGLVAETERRHCPRLRQPGAAAERNRRARHEPRDQRAGQYGTQTDGQDHEDRTSLHG